jgi:hypothetical protein
MNNKVMTKPSEVVRDFFQELVAGLPTGNMGAVDRHLTPDVEMIIVGTTSPELLQVIPWGGKHVGPRHQVVARTRPGRAFPDAETNRHTRRRHRRFRRSCRLKTRKKIT